MMLMWRFNWLRWCFFVVGFLAGCTSVSSRPEWDGRVVPGNGEPVCVHDGVRPEGWLEPNGEIRRDHCTERAVFCSRVGTPFEGWHAAEIGTVQLINRERCSKFQNDKPECIFLSSHAEGWTAPSWTDRRVHWDSCRNKVVVCRNHGTDEEGWYALMPKMKTAYLVKSAPCGKILIPSTYR